jgi:hypothetical protein
MPEYMILEKEEIADFDAAWRDTMARRLDELETGRVQPVNGPAHLARLRAKIAAWEG